VLNISLVIYHDIYVYGVNTGTIAFFTLAEKYLRGDFYNAVAGGYGPLSSLLLVPFLKMGLDHKPALCVVNLILGALILMGTRALSYRFEMTENMRNIISFSAIPIVLNFSLTENIPDLLIVCTGIFYMNIIFSENYPDRASKGFICGIIGAVGYLGKAFMFPFFISHFLLFNMLHYLRAREKNKEILRNAILGMLMFALMSGAWIMVLSKKYDKITFDVSGTYNHRIIGPEVKKISKYTGWEGWRNMARMGHPVYDKDTAISIWEDFVLLTPHLKPWSPLESWDSFKYQAKMILNNIEYTIGIFESYFSIFSGVIILGYILLYTFPLRSQILRDTRIYPLITMALFCGGYILVYPAERYLWINNILLLLMGAHLLNTLMKNEFFKNNSKKNALIIFFVLSFILIPLRKDLAGWQNNDSEYEFITKEFKDYNDILRGKRIASNDNFSGILLLLYYLDIDAKYYGEAKDDISDEELKNELKKYDIDYYIIWDDLDIGKVPPFLSRHREITGGKISFNNIPGKEGSFVRIYSLKEWLLGF
jgi:hypothetical protein